MAREIDARELDHGCDRNGILSCRETASARPSGRCAVSVPAVIDVQSVMRERTVGPRDRMVGPAGFGVDDGG